MKKIILLLLTIAISSIASASTIYIDKEVIAYANTYNTETFLRTIGSLTLKYNDTNDSGFIDVICGCITNNFTIKRFYGYDDDGLIFYCSDKYGKECYITVYNDGALITYKTYEFVLLFRK